ncbi:MAG TPA: DotU family type IV/VI secretion system protein [Bryobacteraceae bacterium]|nr:DotU family type IV/VI secretion system protein [Bryobacteraceae bacterium]
MPQSQDSTNGASGTSGPTTLALIFEDLLTAIIRLRSGQQQVSNAEHFRNQIVHAIQTADQKAKTRGYVDEDIRLVAFALVAFLDESILNLRQPAFQDWARKPLQEELFGRHVAGEVFFQNLDHLLGRRDSPEVADVLEVYYLSILLGYLGRFSIASKGDLRALMDQTQDKIQRIRKSGADLSPHWMIPAEAGQRAGRDPWARRLIIAAGACALGAGLLFGVYKMSLSSSVSGIEQLAARPR